ncbi:uncharacterized protein si:ch211-269k10.4 [Engraulis encrasicolus]|uniref:uncharacterized protein si:ch211-269k10.4 n=1 Tax=Engraulis encrasicolus TaxID=184585 RepID=UPI002FD67218
MASAKVSLSISEEGGEEEEKRRVRGGGGGRGGRGGRGEESRGGRGRGEESRGGRGRGGRGEESGGGEEEEDKAMLVRHYQAQEMVLPRKPLLHPLLDKQISAWASVQVCAGVCSFALGVVLASTADYNVFALGVVFASTADFNSFLIVLFRIPFLNGALTEVLVLVVTVIQIVLSGLLVFWIYREQKRLKTTH